MYMATIKIAIAEKRSTNGQQIAYFTIREEEQQATSDNYQWMLVGDWTVEEQLAVQESLLPLLEGHESEYFDLYKETPGDHFPYRATVYRIGRTLEVKAYDFNALLENISACYDPLPSANEFDKV